MKVSKEYGLLVMVGYWNKAIFNENWVKENLITDSNLIQEFPLNPDASSRFSTENYRFLIHGNSLSFFARNEEDETFDSIQELGLKIYQKLPHTPVVSFGVNFRYVVDSNINLNGVFEFQDNEKYFENEYSIESSTISRAILFDHYVLNLSIEKSDESYSFGFNYHFNIGGLGQFQERLSEKPIVELRKDSLKLLKDIYDIELQQ